MSPKKRRIFRKSAWCPVGKNNCKCWACGEVGHYANECKNRKNNKLIKTLGSLDCVELSENEAIDLALALNNNKGIVKIILDNEYVKSQYEKTSHIMESSSISLGDLQGEEFVVDNEEVKGDWVLPIIQKDMIYKKSIF